MVPNRFPNIPRGVSLSAGGEKTTTVPSSDYPGQAFVCAENNGEKIPDLTISPHKISPKSSTLRPIFLSKCFAITCIRYIFAIMKGF